VDLLDTVAAVETPERVRFRYRLAGPGRRGVAWGADLLVRGAVAAVVFALLAVVGVLPGLSGFSAGAGLVVVFLLDWFYGAAFEWLMAGQTPGKLMLGIRVVRSDGAPASAADCVLRNLLRAVDLLPGPGGVGLVVMTLDDRMRRLGDLVAGTVVVVDGVERVHGSVEVRPPVTDQERQALPARVQLRRDELLAIEALLRRRDRLSAERVEELAALLAPALAERTGVEASSHERVLALAYARAVGKAS
jgi:uncharacterized RDD family membrane protein YckC